MTKQIEEKNDLNCQLKKSHIDRNISVSLGLEVKRENTSCSILNEDKSNKQNHGF